MENSWEFGKPSKKKFRGPDANTARAGGRPGTELVAVRRLTAQSGQTLLIISFLFHSFPFLKYEAARQKLKVSIKTGG